MGRSLEFTDHTQFVRWSHLPEQQHGAQQPDTIHAASISFAAVRKRQKLAQESGTVKAR